MPDRHRSHGELLPEETTPQGTQEDAVLFGHEARDMNLRQVVAWFLGTAISTFIVQILIFGAWGAWQAYEARQEKLPSPLFGASQVPPPPLLEPNPADALSHKDQPIRLGPDYLHEYRVNEAIQLQRLGLENPTTGRPEIPPKVLTAVMKDQAGPLQNPPGAAMSLDSGTAPGAGVPTPPASSPTDPMVRLLPSEASGGTLPENGLR